MQKSDKVRQIIELYEAGCYPPSASLDDVLKANGVTVDEFKEYWTAIIGQRP